MPEAASVLIGPAEIALTRIAFSPEIGREIADARLERRLGDAHDVVVRHPLLGAIVGQRQHRAAVGHQLLGALGDGSERIAGDGERFGEIVFRRVDIAAGQLVLVGEGDAMDDEVDRSPQFSGFREHRVDRGAVGDVAMAEDMGAQFLRERPDALFQRVALET